MLRSLAAALLLTTAAQAQTDADPLLSRSWDDIVADARGDTVTWFMWGGSDTINAYVSDHLGEVLKRNYDITLNRVPITICRESDAHDSNES